MTSEFEAPLYELRRETSRESEERGEAGWTGSVTHSPESPLFARRAGLGGPTTPAARVPSSAPPDRLPQRRS